MKQVFRQSSVLFGYLSTWESADLGCFGGYLVVSLLGRPLEFHCTAPLRPSRAEQILYGPTLHPYLLGEQIGGALLSEAKSRPQIILTDHAATFCLRHRVEAPIVRLATTESSDRREPIAEGRLTDISVPSASGGPEFDNRETTHPLAIPPLLRIMVADYELELPPGHEADRNTAIELLTMLAERVDLAEPFGRIREAIREAQRVDEREQDAYGRSAA
jgi:hypothetical protein